MKVALAIGFYLVGNILAWFQFNSQFVWPWWKDKSLLSVLIYAIPMCLCFYYGTRILVTEYDSLWTARLGGFGLGIMIFSLLTYGFMGESVFTFKTMSCIVLSFAIVLIQLFYK